MPKNLYIGKSVPRIDGISKVTGSAKYTADLFLQEKGALFVKILRSPHPHAKIISLDVSKAEKSKGVKLILTGKDVPEKVTWESPRILSREETRWAGEPVAAVAAESPELAEEALELIDVDYKKLPAVFDAEEAMKPECNVVVDPEWGNYPGSLHKKSPEQPNVTGHFKLRRGNIEKGFAEADLILENRFSTPRIHHSQLEPISSIAQPDGNGGLTLWTNAQGVYGVREILCDVLNLPLSKVRVINPYQGGSFGNRLRINGELLIAIMALKTSKMVKITFSREEMYISSISRRPVITYIKTGVKKDGTICAQEMKIIIDNGGSYAAIEDGRLASSGAVCVYRIPNFYIDSYGVNTNTPPSGPYRGLGSTQVAWVVESQMDMLAERLGISPVEIRRKNILSKGEENAFAVMIIPGVQKPH